MDSKWEQRGVQREDSGVTIQTFTKSVDNGIVLMTICQVAGSTDIGLIFVPDAETKPLKSKVQKIEKPDEAETPKKAKKAKK